MMKQLWKDDGGAMISAELALVGTILVIGVVVGLSAVQDAVNTELADLGQAIASLDQSYSTGGATGHHASVAASAFADALDSCDEVGTAGGASRCLTLCLSAAGAESGASGSGSGGGGPR